jgi:hypothetical protein
MNEAPGVAERLPCGQASRKRVVIGVDFDNTLVTYDELLHRMAVERGLIASSVVKSKSAIRETIWRLPEGGLEWQRLQALVYGPRIGEATLSSGVREFFVQGRAAHARLVIISHKTECSPVDETKTNLRAAALAWMRAHRFFEPDGLGLSPDEVFFESSRSAKIQRIVKVGCTHFIDDLEETFLEPTFPADVTKILYASHGHRTPRPGVHCVATWKEAADALFHP